MDSTVLNLGATDSVPTNTWAHIALTFSESANSIRGFVNGRLTGTGTYTPVFGATGVVFNICTRNSANAQWWPGRLDDVRLWRRTLTEAEVAQVYQESLRGDPRFFPPALVVGGLPDAGARGQFFPFFQP
jgi:hypothetical protein